MYDPNDLILLQYCLVMIGATIGLAILLRWAFRSCVWFIAEVWHEVNTEDD